MELIKDKTDSVQDGDLIDDISSIVNNDLIMIEKIKNSGAAFTTYGETTYSFCYVDTKNKIGITFTPRGGCSISFQQYLDLLGLLEDGLNYHPFIHTYRCNLFIQNIPSIPIDELINQKYLFIKCIINPYIRAVSIYRMQTSHNLSFREYLKQLVNNQIDYFNDNEKYHLEKQYISGEENIINKYIRINENETCMIQLHNGEDYLVDVNRYTSGHHGKKTFNTSFCGDISKDQVNECLPSSYKYFYDDEIKQIVETYYKDDIEKYGFSFDF
jgi:hypothetical protein